MEPYYLTKHTRLGAYYHHHNYTIIIFLFTNSSENENKREMAGIGGSGGRYMQTPVTEQP